MIASQAVRAATPRRVVRPRPRHTQRLARTPARATFEVRTFVTVSLVIAAAFLLAMLYLAQTTTVSTLGYQAQHLQQVRDELRRQNALLEVENARLDSPARIETAATKLGLVRAVRVPVVQIEPITAKQ